MKKPLLFISFNILIILGLSFVQVVIANNISTTGIELGRLQQDLEGLKKKNANINEQVLGSSSLYNIASRAAELGFSDNKNQLVIQEQLPLAKR